MSRRLFAAAAILSVISCGSETAKAPDLAATKPLDGYADIKFGERLDEALATIPAGTFSAYGLRECRETGMLYGCRIGPDDDLTQFAAIDGIPFALVLSVNAAGVVTDVELAFNRRVSGGSGPRFSRQECLSVFERALDWTSREYGAYAPPKKLEKAGLEERATRAGNVYWPSRGTSYATFRTIEKPLQRSVTVFSSYMVVNNQPSCAVEITFADSANIERWKLPPDEQREFDRIGRESQ